VEVLPHAAANKPKLTRATSPLMSALDTGGRYTLTRRHFVQSALIGGAAAAACAAGLFVGWPFASSQVRRSSVLPWPEARSIVAETVLPSFPDSTFVVTDPRYGAVGDGNADDTMALASAIEDCSSRGGGHVVLPEGVYSTGALRLQSNVDLHLEAGALLRFDGDPDRYPVVLTRYEGIECLNRSPMVYAYGESNIAVTGAGVLDASQTQTWNSGSNRAAVLEPMVAAGLPPEQRVVPEHGRLRSAFVEPYACTNVLIQGVTLRGAQFWQLHPTLCRNVTVDSVRTGDTTSLNTDACNPESCDHVVIRGCAFNAFDDCIALKSGRDADGRRVDTPCQNVVITGCAVQGPAGGVALGSEMTGGIRNVYVHDVRTFGRSVQHMLYAKSNTRRGGYAVNIRVDSATADHLGGAWAFAQMDYDGQVGDFGPTFEDWAIGNSTGDLDPMVLQLSGLDGNPIRGIRIRDSAFTHVLFPIDAYDHVEDVAFEGVTINGWGADR